MRRSDDDPWLVAETCAACADLADLEGPLPGGGEAELIEETMERFQLVTAQVPPSYCRAPEEGEGPVLLQGGPPQIGGCLAPLPCGVLRSPGVR